MTDQEKELAALDRAIAKFQARLADPAAKPVTEMTAGETNKEVAKLRKLDLILTDQFIAAGRGLERPSDRRGLQDPLTTKERAIHDRLDQLRVEKHLRYGPGLLGDLPKGFGPRTWRSK